MQDLQNQGHDELTAHKGNIASADSCTTQRRILSDLPILAILAGVVLVAAAIFLAMAIANSRQERRTVAGSERHTFEVLVTSRDLLTALQNAETGNRGYLITGDTEYLVPFDQGLVEAPRQLRKLRQLTIDNPSHQTNLGLLSEVIDLRLARLQQGVELEKSGNHAGAIGVVRIGRGKELMDHARTLLAKIDATETRLLAEHIAKSDAFLKRTDRLMLTLIVLIAAMAIYGLLAMTAAIRAQGRSALLEAEQEAASRLREADMLAVRSAAVVTALGDAVPDLIYAKDTQGRMLYANPSTLAVIGKSMDDVLGRLTAEYHRDLQEAAAIDASDSQVIASGQTMTIDEVYTDAEGNRRLFRSTKTPLRNQENKVFGLAGVTIDVTAERSAMTELKASEERFRTLSDTVPAFIFITDDRGEITYTNTAFQQYTGKSNEQLLGMGWIQTLHSEDRNISLKVWREAVANEKPYEAEYRFGNSRNEFRSFMVRATPLRDALGRIVQWVGTCSDIQDSIDAREAAEALNQELESKVVQRTAALQSAIETLQIEIEERETAEGQVRHLQKIESIGQLTGGIAHDFNNMLAVILGSLEIVKRRIHSDPDRAISAVENAEEGARRAALLTSRLLAYSRQQPLAPEPIDANKLVSSMSSMLRATIGEHIKIETVLAGGLWKTHIDAPQLENAILNLCVNARDAMPGGGKLTIETQNYHLDEFYAGQNSDVEPGQYVLVCVSDTGSGMPPQVIERAFDPFFTTKEVGKGTGLGLSQVYGFVKQSGGHIKIYSEEAQGTSVKLYLPRFFGSGDGTSSTTDVASGKLPTAKSGEVVMVVEDESQVRDISVQQLRDLGYLVLEAANGAEALELVASNSRIDLIFTDIVMPGMNGRALADKAAMLRTDIKILFTTGYTRNAVVHNGVLDAGTEFIAKPYTGFALAKKVRTILDGGGPNISTAGTSQ